MLDRLEHETRAHHPDADSPWGSLLSTGFTRAGYIDQLIAVYGFEAPLDAALALTPRVRLALPARPRVRAGRVVQDLLAMGLTASCIARLPQCTSFSMFRDACEALGWIYAAERTSRLHDTVLRHVAPHLPGAGSSYLLTSAADARPRWDRLGEALERVVDTAHGAAQVIDAAHRAFACQRAWFLGEPQAAARGA